MVVLEISQNSQENTRSRVSLLKDTLNALLIPFLQVFYMSL